MKQYYITCICFLMVFQLNVNAQLLPEKMKPNVIYTYDLEEVDRSDQPFLKKIRSVWESYLTFTENLGGIYCLSFDVSVSPDMIREMIFSYGSYQEKNGEIILTDAVHNYQMHLTKKNKKVCFTKGLYWFKNRCFELQEDGDYRRGQIPRYLVDVDKARAVNKKEHPKTIPVTPGVYKDENYSLNLLPGQKYDLYFNDIKIETGKWSTQSGELLLYSNDGSTIFYLRSTEKGLISQLLPGDNKRAVLKKIKTK